MKRRIGLGIAWIALIVAGGFAAERPWQTGTWAEVRTTRPRVVFGLQPSPNGPGPHTPPTTTLVRVYVIETDVLRFELTDIAPASLRTVGRCRWRGGHLRGRQEYALCARPERPRAPPARDQEAHQATGRVKKAAIARARRRSVSISGLSPRYFELSGPGPRRRSRAPGGPAVKDSRSIDAWLRMSVSRRAFLGGLALCGIAPTRLAGGVAPRRDLRFRTSPFTLGVASGDPTADGVVLWTRLAPDPLTGGGMPPVDVEVSWLIAADDRLQEGRPAWSDGRQSRVGSLGARRSGGPRPRRWYWYQFRVGDQLSPIGRTRTLPREGAAAGRLRFAFVSCQNYEIGYFTAYQHAAAEDLDVIFHLGDYIYEGAGLPGRPRSHAGPELTHAARLSDPVRGLQDRRGPAGGARRVPVDRHLGRSRSAEQLRRRRLAGQRSARRCSSRAAPPRIRRTTSTCRSGRPARSGPSMRLYRRFTFGSLASFFVLDTRQYRTDQPCGDGGQPPCPGVFDPQATLLGASQERWLLRRSRRLARPLERSAAAGHDGAGGSSARPGPALRHGPVGGV